MHELIMGWSSKELYNSRLIAHESVANHTITDLSSLAVDVNPLVLIDTAGSLMYETVDQEQQSSVTEYKSNVGEADLVLC